MCVRAHSVGQVYVRRKRKEERFTRVHACLALSVVHMHVRFNVYEGEGHQYVLTVFYVSLYMHVCVLNSISILLRENIRGNVCARSCMRACVYVCVCHFDYIRP